MLTSAETQSHSHWEGEACGDRWEGMVSSPRITFPRTEAKSRGAAAEIAHSREEGKGLVW
jgi:hypothetical protein